MLDQSVRTAILELRERGLSVRRIARTLKVSRGAVRDVIKSGSAEVPQLELAEKAEPYRQQTLELLANCKGNLVRVHEKLTDEGCELSYQYDVDRFREADWAMNSPGMTMPRSG